MWIVILLVVGFILLVLVPAAANLYTQYLWFASVGQSAVFSTEISTQVTLFALGAGVFLVLAMINLLIARQVARHVGELPLAREGVLTYVARLQARMLDRLITFGAVGLAIGVAIVMGLVVSGQWLEILRYLHPVPFGVKDPLFNLDVAFYVFQLPIYRFLQGWLIAADVLILGLCAVYYALRSYGFNFQVADLGALLSLRAIRVHLFTLLAILALLLAVGYRFDAYDLVYAHRGVVHGAGFADQTAQLPALTILSVVAVLMALALFITGLRRSFAIATIGVAAWVFSAIVVGGLYPAAIQQFEVLPSEVTRETPYLKSNIDMTRLAFDLDRIDAQPYPGNDEPPPGVVGRNPQTFSSIRLWDNRPLLSTFNQIQTIRLYYDFTSVDVDRYTINNQYREVMLSARELNPSSLAGQAQTWVTQRLQFTHGYGLAMSPVNEVTAEGLPDLIVKDIPPTGEVPVTRPEIYYGQTDSGYVIVDTSAPEFDYPQGNQNVYTSYKGGGGVLLDSALRKIAFAIVDQDPNILLTSYLQPNSRILYNRNIGDRLGILAPFLVQDADPYLVVAGGQLYWFQDTYTVSDAYPYSTPYNDSYNYVRNSVKAVTNAYDGSIHLYISDPSDPLIRSYAQIFPTLFEPMDQMPAEFRPHVRYPEGMFLIQAEMLRAYHMQDPQVFYNREDLWAVPQEGGQDNQGVMQPYYVIMRLPGQDKEEFLLMLPFTPDGKTNMVAWLAAESDGADYGKLIVFDYPKDKVIFGPQQVEARINQDARISQQLTLWNQQGSHVIHGNLLVLPIENSTLYVEPLYLQASQSQIPELKAVILATQDRLVMGTTLQDSLDQLFGNAAAPALTTPGQTTPSATPTPTATAPTTPPSGDTTALARDAQQHYQAAQNALKTGDWTTYGKEMQAMEADLQQLIQATGG